MSSGCDIGGDGSVAWKIWAGNARKGTVVTRISGCEVLQKGIDETEPGESFAISLKIPREGGAEFARGLMAAAKDAEAHCGDPDYYVTFPLIIEPETYKQIQVRWENAPPPKAMSAKRRAPQRAKASAKPRPAAKGRTRPVKKGPPKAAKKKAGKKR
jgi:hypothetical protein